jgi:hypothetical protein
LAALGHETRCREEGNGGHRRAGADGGTGDGDRWMMREEQRRERDDEHQSGKNEAEAAHDSAQGAAQSPGAEDCELRGRGTGQQVG